MSSTAPQEPPRAYPDALRSTVPGDLLELVRWVVWKLEPPAKPRADGKLTKVPYSPVTGRKARANDPATWGTFSQAVAAYKRGGYTGLGYYPGEGITGVDLDHCRNKETGELGAVRDGQGREHDAAAIVAELGGYAEVSPSGDGVHVWVRGELPPGWRKSGDIEVYAGDHYLTVTGETLAGAGALLADRSEQLAILHSRVAAVPPKPVNASRPQPAPTMSAGGAAAPAVLSDAEIIRQAERAKNGAKFRALWNGSDGGGASEGDQALVSLLQFYTQDATQLDRLFRQSGRWREKWDERHYANGETYGEHVTANALANGANGEHYSPRKPPTHGTSARREATAAASEEQAPDMPSEAEAQPTPAPIVAVPRSAAELLPELLAAEDFAAVLVPEHLARMAHLPPNEYELVKIRLAERFPKQPVRRAVDKAVKPFRAQVERAEREAAREERARATVPGRDIGERDASGDNGDGATIPANARYLTDCQHGDIWVVDEGPRAGIYIAAGKRAWCVCGAEIEVIRSDSSEAARTPSVHHVRFTLPGEDKGAKELHMSQRAALGGECYSPLHGYLREVPTGKKDFEIMWRAVCALAHDAKADGRGVHRRIVEALGWDDAGMVFVHVNGYVDASGAHVGDDIAAAVPSSWLQTLPAHPEQLPQTVKADVLRLLSEFYSREVSYFPLAALGSFAHVTRRSWGGRARYELELYGASDWLKSTIIHWFLRLFSGSGYTYDSHPLLTEGIISDTRPGEIGTRAAMRYQPFETPDRDAHPEQGAEYHRQNEKRIASAMATGNRTTGGMRSNKDGGLEARGTPAGLAVGTGEVNPLLYTVKAGKRSADERNVLYWLEGESGEQGRKLLARSEEIERHAAELDTAHIWYLRYLATLGADGEREQAQRLYLDAVRRVAAVDASGAYPNRHSRCIANCRDMVAGILSYCAFLRAVDSETGTHGHVIEGGAVLADEIEAEIPAFIHERFAFSQERYKLQVEAQGGATAHEVLATAVCRAIRLAALRGPARIHAQNGGAPSDRWALPEHKGWELQPAFQENELPRWKGKPNTFLFGWEVDAAKYVGCTRDALDQLLSEAAPHEARISYTSLTRLLRQLAESGVILRNESNPETPYTHERRVHTPDADTDTSETAGAESKREKPRLVLFYASSIWPDGAEAAGEYDL